jgi:predicted ATPase
MPSKTASGSWIVVTGLDGAGKTTLVHDLGVFFGARTFRLPLHDFVRPMLLRSGDGEPFSDIHTDRLLFALDARLANYQIGSWRKAVARVSASAIASSLLKFSWPRRAS